MGLDGGSLAFGLLLSLARSPLLRSSPRGPPNARRRRLPGGLAAVAQHGALRLRCRRRGSGEGRRRRRGEAEAARALRGDDGPGAGPRARAAPEVPLLRAPLAALPLPPPSPPPPLRRLALRPRRKAGILS